MLNEFRNKKKTANSFITIQENDENQQSEKKELETNKNIPFISPDYPKKKE